MIRSIEVNEAGLLSPLRAVIGCGLCSVKYFVLSADANGFDLNHPNADGCQIVCLTMNTGQSVFFSWETNMLNDGTEPDYLLAAAETNKWGIAGGLQILDASTADPWNHLMGLNIHEIEIFGDGTFPVAACIKLANNSAIIACGYSDSESSRGAEICGGDTLLVYNEWPESNYSLDALATLPDSNAPKYHA